MSAENHSGSGSESKDNKSESGENLAGVSRSSSDDSEGRREERGGDVARELESMSQAVLVARLLEAEARAKEADERAREADERARKADERAALRSGNYYSSIDQVWADKDRHFDHHAYFDYLRRDIAPDFASPDGINYYETTLEKARDPASIAAVIVAWPQTAPPVDVVATAAAAAAAAAAGSTSSPAVSSSRVEFPGADVLWPVDVFGTPKQPLMQLAHLVPHIPQKSTLYFDVVACVLGLQDTKEGGQGGPGVVVPPGWDTVQKAIHGATTTASSAAGEKEKRATHTGIKHSVPNIIRLKGQAEYFDKRPCLLIVPILTLDKAKAWKGEGYDALVLAGEIRGERAGVQNALLVQFSTVCIDVGMYTEGGREANREEIEQGCTLLTSFLLGMAYSLKRRTPARDRHLTQKQRTKLEGFRAQFPADAKHVLVPVPNPNAPEPLRVRVVEFRGAAEVDDVTKKQQRHLAPDPLLLAVRAAINWSRRRGQPLLAAAEPVPDVYETEYEREMEQYFESRDRDLRPPDDDLVEFARRLGQLPPDKAATAAAR
jgi:hypothetical protein